MTAPTEPTGAPVMPSTPTPPAVPATPTPAQVFPPQQPATQPTASARPAGEHGFPENTPLAEMTDREQANYHKYHSRRWQARAEERADYDDLKAKAARLAEIEQQNMTDTQRAVAEAEQRGRAAALADAGSRIVDTMFRAALHGRRSDTEISDLLIGLDRSSFLTADGLGVDTDKVTRYVNVVAPAPVAPAPTPPAAVVPVTGAPQPRPDMGQGTRSGVKPGGLEAGRLIAQQRFGTAK